MASFAKVVNGIVTKVIVADQDFIDNMVDTSPGSWIETHYDADGTSSTKYNYAGKGYHYDSTAEAFYEPKPKPSFVLDTDTYTWAPPVAYPTPTGDETYRWDEDSESWVEETL